MITALIAVLPALIAIAYLQVVERREAEQRIGPVNTRLVRLAADEYTGTLIGARRLLGTLAAVPMLAGHDSVACRVLMAAVLAKHSGYVNLAAANMDGSVFCAAKPMDPRLIRAATDQSWFVRTIRSRAGSLGDAQVSATTGRPAILLGEPVFDASGRMVHVLVATVDLAALSQAVVPSTLPPGSTLTLFNQDGIVLARTPHDAHVGERAADTHLLEAARHAHSTWSDEHVARDGVRRVYTTIAVSEFPGLFVTLGVDHATAYAEVSQILRRYAALIILGSFAAMLAGAFGGQAFVVQPVMKLKRVMMQLASGDLSARASLGGAAYGLSELEEAVNRMASSLEDRYRERATAEHLAEATENRLRFALEAANVGIWEADVATGTSYWSPECERMHGLAPGSFGGTLEAFIACVHPADRDDVARRTADAARTPSLVSFTYRAVWSNGTTRVLTSSARFAFENGQPLRGAGVVLDITERVELEEQLRHSQKMEAVGQLAGGIAHDFNNLLTIILGNTELLVLDQAPAAERPELAEVRAAAKRAADLTRQLLAFSRKQALTLRPTELGEVVDALAPMLRRLIGEDIHVHTISTPDPTVVMIDRAQFEQALINLAVNARDAMPNGGVLTIETGTRELNASEISAARMELSPGPHAVVRVIDTGEGMAPDVLAHAFEPFYTTKEVGQGTGLGLSSVYGSMKQCGGHVMASSRVSMGTCITIYLPLLGKTQAAAAPHGLESPAIAPARTVLLVEDDDSVRALSARILTSAGYRVLAAPDGSEALAQARTYDGDLDLILTDVVMPGLPVSDMIAALRLERPGVPVLMMSGYPDQDIVRRGIMTSTVRFFHKPFEAGELLSNVADAIHATPIESLSRG